MTFQKVSARHGTHSIYVSEGNRFRSARQDHTLRPARRSVLWSTVRIAGDERAIAPRIRWHRARKPKPKKPTWTTRRARPRPQGTTRFVENEPLTDRERAVPDRHIRSDNARGAFRQQDKSANTRCLKRPVVAVESGAPDHRGPAAHNAAAEPLPLDRNCLRQKQTQLEVQY